MIRLILATCVSLILISCAEVKDKGAPTTQSGLVPDSSVTRLVGMINDPKSAIYTNELEYREFFKGLLNDPDDKETGNVAKSILEGYFKEITEVTSDQSGLTARNVGANAVNANAALAPVCLKNGPIAGAANCPRVCAWGAGFGAAFACKTLTATACVRCGRSQKCTTVTKPLCVYAFAWAFAYACAGGGMTGVVGEPANTCPVALNPKDPVAALFQDTDVMTKTSAK